MNGKSMKSRLLASSVFAGAAFMAQASMLAVAQEADEAVDTVATAADETESRQATVVITGSLIPQNGNLVETSPVTQLSAADFDVRGVVRAEDMINQLHQAAVGKMVISDRLTTLLAEALRSNKPQQASRPDFDSLTPREKDILRLIAEGLSNKMIGRKLDISDGTVKVHVKHLLKKLNLRSRVEVAVWAVEEGLHKG